MAMRIDSVADVRRLATCAKCEGLGMHGTTLVLVSFKADSRGRKRNKVFMHARCMPIEELLALPTEELGTVRLGDVTLGTIEKILAELRRRRG
jgi:hypothetical protein